LPAGLILGHTARTMESYLMSAGLENKISLVTGAAGSLGRAVVERFAAEGAIVHGIYHHSRPEDAGNAVILHQADLADESAVERVFAEIRQRHGRLDILANVAGGFLFGPIAQSSVDDLEKMLSINLRTCWLCCRQAAKVMAGQGGGRIINIASQRVLAPVAGMSCYAAAKAAVAALTGALAKELADQNITVNAVLPGTIDTPPNRAAMPKADFSKWTRPQEIADVVAFLASDAAKAVTGAMIPV
jgi:NAD(P)-dependent dehydrogenase (short-subunit alcohol dehydrogenase family)